MGKGGREGASKSASVSAKEKMYVDGESSGPNGGDRVSWLQAGEGRCFGAKENR